VLAITLAAAERIQVGEEQESGDCLRSPVSSVGALTYKFDGTHLLIGHEGALVPLKQQLRSAQGKELEDLRARLDASEALARHREAGARAAADTRAVLESELEKVRAALEHSRRAQMHS
jgi:hypothetical protein